MTNGKYTPYEVAIKVLQKTEELIKGMPGLQQTKITPVPGAPKPMAQNIAKPMAVGTSGEAAMKVAKPKKLGQAMDKPSVFFKKDQEKQNVKKNGLQALNKFMENKKGKRKI